MADVAVAVWSAACRSPGKFLLSQWPVRVWAFLIVGMLWSAAVLITLITVAVVGFGLVVVGIGLAILVVLALVGIPVGAVERRRLRLVEPQPLIAPHGPLPAPGIYPWLKTRLRERATWRELAYAIGGGILVVVTGVAPVVALAISLLFVAAPLVVWAVAPETVMIIPGRAVAHPFEALPATAVGILGVVAATYVAAAAAGVQVHLARALLAARDDDLGRRVLELTRSRVRMVDAFAAERRRIERDLHDGAQQQLVALSMTLGLAELELRDPDAPAAALVARARKEAAAALSQLRELVAGIHPKVLEDHGLPDAVEELATRSPLPVTVDLALAHRLSEPVETTAYFTVAEALTNAAKHSSATRITVVGNTKTERGQQILVLEVSDDGDGGADLGAGSGLQGLADRLAVLDGRLRVASPVGGPTTIRAEIPCSG